MANQAVQVISLAYQQQVKIANKALGKPVYSEMGYAFLLLLIPGSSQKRNNNEQIWLY
jgi:hypothetical protein